MDNSLQICDAFIFIKQLRTVEIWLFNPRIIFWWINFPSNQIANSSSCLLVVNQFINSMKFLRIVNRFRFIRKICFSLSQSFLKLFNACLQFQIILSQVRNGFLIAGLLSQRNNNLYGSNCFSADNSASFFFNCKTRRWFSVCSVEFFPIKVCFSWSHFGLLAPAGFCRTVAMLFVSVFIPEFGSMSRSVLTRMLPFSFTHAFDRFLYSNFNRQITLITQSQPTKVK